MRFVVKFNALDALRCILYRQSVRYAFKSLGARLVDRIVARFGWRILAEQMTFGDVTYTTGIRECAYRAAERVIDRLPGERWASALGETLDVDLWLIVRKFFFDEYYLKFEFLELALRHAEENPGEPLLLFADFTDLADHELLLARLAARFRLCQRGNTSPLGLATALLLPLFVEFFHRRKGRPGTLTFNDTIICEVDGPATFEMFSTLFAGFPADRLAYLCEARNVGALADRPVDAMRLDAAGLAYLRRAVWRYLGASVAHAGEIASYGSRLFRIFYVLMQGRAETVGGSGNLYCTYEHLVTYKAARNAFLERQGSRTLFVPLNAHVTPQFFHSEILTNYTLMCAAGRHTETLYSKKRSLVQHYLPTGSYASHRRGLPVGDRAARVAALAAFKGDELGVVIISPGICDPTYTHELKLMALARELAAMTGVKVMLRLKPVAPVPKYADFYRREVAGRDNLLVTAGEYDLFDFLDVGDIFLTSISNAAYDLAQAGAIIMFIDYLCDSDLQLPWTLVPAVLMDERKALSNVKRWLRDEPGERKRWQETARRFREVIDYRHASLEAYRENFLQQIAPFLPAGLTLPNERQAA
jgi:hypothetical protein